MIKSQDKIRKRTGKKEDKERKDSKSFPQILWLRLPRLHEMQNTGEEIYKLTKGTDQDCMIVRKIKFTENIFYI